MPLTLADASAPPHTIEAFRGPDTTIAKMVQLLKSPRGEQSVVVRQAVQEVVRGLQPKDYLSEILAIRNWVGEKVRYANDPASVEWVADPQRLIEDIIKHGRAVADCDEIALLIATMARQVGRDAQFVTVGFSQPNRFTHVFARVKEPKSGAWIVCDPVAGTDEARMLKRVTTHKIWDIG